MTIKEYIKIYSANSLQLILRYVNGSKDELKDIDIKSRTCYNIDDIIANRDIYYIDILSDKKALEDISVYDVSYKASMGPKALPISSNKIDAFMVLDDKTKHY